METIQRQVSMGVSKENTYGVQNDLTADFPLGIVDLTYNEIINKMDNTSMMGTDYEVNDLQYTTRQMEFTIKGKVSENELPLLLMQKFDIESELVSGESAVYRHTLSYNTNNAPASGQSLTLFWKDPELGDMYSPGARFDKVDFIFAPNDFLYYEISGKAMFPTEDSITLAFSSIPLDFTGRNVVYEYASNPLKLLSATLRHQFNLSGDDDNFVLGSGELNKLYTMQTMFTQELKAMLDSYDVRDNWRDNDEIETFFNIVNSGRYVAGSTENTNPSIRFDYPKVFISDWKRTGGANELRKQEFTTKAVSDPAVSNSPAEITIVNAVASY